MTTVAMTMVVMTTVAMTMVVMTTVVMTTQNTHVSGT